MGQIVFNGQKPKYCNLQSIQTGGKHVNDDVAIGEIWLVDTTNSDKGLSGKGKYDAYIIGDGIKKAGQLTLNYIDTPIDMSSYSTTLEMQAAIQNAINSADIPRNLSDLSEDSTHRTVTDSEKAAWNSSGGGGGGNPVDNEDLTLVEQEGINVIKFKDKVYAPVNYSGLGRKYLRKNIVTVPSKTLSENYVYTEGSIIDVANYSIGETIPITPRESTGGAYCLIDVSEGDSFYVSGRVDGASRRVWGLIDENNVLLAKRAEMTIDLAFGSEVVTAPANGKLIANTHMPSGIDYRLAKIVDGETASLNVLTQEMFDSANTIYIVQYDYTLNFSTITLPANSILLFEGGSIKDGGIVGNNSVFVTNDTNKAIFNADTYLSGSWKNTVFTPELFGAAGNGVNDDYVYLQKCLDTIHTIKGRQIKTMLLNNVYLITNGLLVYENTCIKGAASNTFTNGVYTIIANFENKKQWVIDSVNISHRTWDTFPMGKLCPYDKFARAKSADEYVHYEVPSIYIENVSINATVTTDANEVKHYIYGGIRIQRSLNSHLSVVCVRNTWIGVARSATWYSSDRDLWITAKFISIYFGQDCNQSTLYNCYANVASSLSDIDRAEYPNVVSIFTECQTNIVINYSKVTLINPITQGGGYAFSIINGSSVWHGGNNGANVVIEHPYIEGYYRRFFNVDKFTLCTVINGVYVAKPVEFFSFHSDTSANLVHIGNVSENFISYTPSGAYFINTQQGSIADGVINRSSFTSTGQLIYSGNKLYAVSSRGACGVDGYNYQTSFTGSTLPSETYLKVGTPFLLQQTDRTLPVFESVSGTDCRVRIKINSLPNKSGTVTFTIFGTTVNVSITYFEGITDKAVNSQLYYTLGKNFKCGVVHNQIQYIYMYIKQTNIPDGASLSFTDTDNTGLNCTVSLYNQAITPQYVDFFGNAAGFNYASRELPATAIEGTIIFWKSLGYPIYFKGGKWYNFANQEQSLILKFSDNSTIKTQEVPKTGGTYTFTGTSEVNEVAKTISAIYDYDYMVESTITMNGSTFTVEIQVEPTVYTSDIEIPITIYQDETFMPLQIVLTVSAGDSTSNITISNNNVKNAFLTYDTTDDGELSYDEALQVTTFNQPLKNIIGTSSDYVTIDFRVFPNLTTLYNTSMFSGSNYLNIIVPSSLTSFGATRNAFRYMGDNNNLVCLSMTPPTDIGIGITNMTNIYVPEGAIDAYINAGYPSGRVKGLNEITDSTLRELLGLAELEEPNEEPNE